MRNNNSEFADEAKQKFYKIWSGIILLFFALSFASTAYGAEETCFCRTDLSKITDFEKAQKEKTILVAQCLLKITTKECTVAKQSAITKGKINAICGMVEDCKGKHDVWITDLLKLEKSSVDKVANKETESTGGSPSQLSALITKCGQTDDKECRDVSVFIEVLLQIVSYLFGIIGAIALGMFVYGGFMLILSQGNPEKVKQGTGAMINAVIGLVIAFGGYVLISFLSDAIGVKTDFRLK